jgi:hypothetical protein
LQHGISVVVIDNGNGKEAWVTNQVKNDQNYDGYERDQKLRILLEKRA